MFLGIALEVPDPVSNIENRYKSTNKSKRCKIHEDNRWSKSEKDNIAMSKEQHQSSGESIGRAHSN